MDIESIRRFCLSLPHTTEDIQWGNDLLFRIGGKIFASVSLEGAGHNNLCFKCTPEEFAVLVEQDDIVPAPYVARYHWVSLKRLDALPAAEIKRRIQDSYDMVFAKLPKRVRTQLIAAASNRQKRK